MAQPPPSRKNSRPPSAAVSSRPRRCATSTSPSSTCCWPSSATTGPSKALKACGADLKRLEKKPPEFLAETHGARPAPPARGAADPRRQPRAPARRHPRALVGAEGHRRGSRARRDLPRAGVARSSSCRRRASRASTSSTTTPTASRNDDDEAARPESNPLEGAAAASATPAPAAAAATTRRTARPGEDPLEQFTQNLNQLAAEGKIDPLIGRALELERTIRVLCRRRKNNPLYVGEPGVGKTAIAEGLALAIHEGNVPRCSRTRWCTPSTWARCSRAPSSAGSSRSASRPCSRP
jgi:ATP-dependent Clp protease ATP-binding subunit ClpA